MSTIDKYDVSEQLKYLDFLQLSGDKGKDTKIGILDGCTNGASQEFKNTRIEELDDSGKKPIFHRNMAKGLC